MNQKNKDIILYSIAVIFFLILVCGIIFYSIEDLYIGLFWICYPAITLILLGIVFKKPTLILSQVIIIMIPDFLWIIDFFYLLFTGNPLLGITNYFFDNNYFLKKMLTLQHIFTLPLSIIALSLIKTKKDHKIILISFLELMTFFVIGFILPARYGINCLPNPRICTSITPPDFISYPLLWIIIEFSFVIISYLVMNFLPFLYKKDILKS